MNLFDQTAFKSSRIITNSYSTSFSLGIKILAKKFHMPIYAIYGFVRYADEIVDTFHDHDKENLLKEFKHDTYEAIERKISLNPVLQSFQLVVNKYKIDRVLIDAFLKSMAMDLTDKKYDMHSYKEYIYGSAEVVGLMCLKVFCEGDKQLYDSLTEPAKSLGSAFQKVNFLRDIESDYYDRGREYFPGIDFNNFNSNSKKAIENDIQSDFDHAINGIMKLPKGAKLGVYLAYIYYVKLFQKIKLSPVSQIKKMRVRIPDNVKMYLFLLSWIKYRLKII